VGKKSTKKIEGHGDLAAGEVLIDACYGLGKGFLLMADRAGGPRRHHAYGDEASAATSEPEGSEAARLDRNGILALTDQRLIFLPVKTAVRKPKAVAASWDHAEIADVLYDKPMLTVTFGDGSIGGLHVPRNEKPDDFLAHVRLAIGST